jgi:cell division protein FtsL
MESTDRRIVYNGEFVKQASGTRTNRPVKRRKRSPVSLVFIVMTVSFLTVSYIWNKITVIRLAEEVNNLQMQHQKILSANEILRAEISQKSKLERIGKIATEQLGLTYPKEQPVWLDVDPDRLREFQEE